MIMLSERLRLLLETRGKSQKELALYLHLSNGTISNYVNGVHQPCVDTLINTARFFDVSIDYLLGESKSPFRHEQLPEAIHGGYTVSDFQEDLAYLTNNDRACIAYITKALKEHRKPKRGH